MISLYVVIVFLIGIACSILFLYAMFKQNNRLAALFSVMCLALTIYVLGYGFELLAKTLEQIWFIIKIEYFGASFMTVFWLMFAFKFRFNRLPSFKLNLAILVIPILTLLFCVTNEYHHLLYTDVSAQETGGFLIAQITRGPWYYVHSIYSYCLILTGIYFFFLTWRKSKSQLKLQAFWMFSGTLFPVVINLTYLSGIDPYGLDLTPLGLIVLVIAYFIALFRYDFLELKEIVRGVAFSEIKEGIIVVDAQNRLIDFNKSAQNIFRWLSADQISMPMATWPEGQAIVRPQSSPFDLQVVNDGETQLYEFRITPLEENHKHMGNIYFFSDVTTQRQLLQDLNFMASFDSMTQIYNRRRLLEEAQLETQRLLRYGGNMSVLMIDIDHFKQVNDRYGHKAGDEVIRMVVRVCQNRCRETDIFGRYGGEEFVLVLKEADSKKAMQIAEFIRKQVEDTVVRYEGEEIRITVSIGIASVSGTMGVSNIDVIINEADIALYKVKNSGRNGSFVYTDEMRSAHAAHSSVG